MQQTISHDPVSPTLTRELGVGGAMLMGLGSILGTGVFVSLGVAAGVAGPSVILATALAALVAACNALSSAQLAAAHPVSGGTYEYGYTYLTPSLGFTAGWMFLCAKSASAATAALGLAGYLLEPLDAGRFGIVAGVAVVLTLTAIAAGGLRNSNRTNAAIVTCTVFALVVFVIAVAPAALREGTNNVAPFWPASGGPAFLHATALMFVAYTGYGRIATLGEEVRDPQRTIPRAIVMTLLVSAILYVSVAAAAVGSAGATQFGELATANSAPLEQIARRYAALPGAGWLLALGAMTAMAGVLLNLILGLSRVVLSMGRRGDMPAIVARVRAQGRSPAVAVWCVGAVIGALVLLGDVRATWSFSALTVLVYYAITNLAALRLPPAQRRYPRAVAWAGLASCLFLTVWIDLRTWAVGLIVMAAGAAWHGIARARRTKRA